MENKDQLTLSDLATDLQNWKLLYLDKTYPQRYKEKMDYFKQRVKKEEGKIL